MSDERARSTHVRSIIVRKLDTAIANKYTTHLHQRRSTKNITVCKLELTILFVVTMPLSRQMGPIGHDL